jgi:predicted nucleotide-binding protein
LDLIEVANILEEKSEAFEMRNRNLISRLLDEVKIIERSWSGSNLGYHADVYYAKLAPRPPHAQFSAEWGLKDKGLSRLGSVGDWHEFDPQAVNDKIFYRAGEVDLTNAHHESLKLRNCVEVVRSEVVSELTLSLAEATDDFLLNLKAEASKLNLFSANQFGEGMVSRGEVFLRDLNALQGGRRLAPHQKIMAEILALNAPALAAIELAKVARKAGSHLERRAKKRVRAERVGTNVFIGHGQSPLWRELKDFVVDRLKLPYEEFNRVPVAGITNIARLSEMLEGAACALVVLTAEDEQTDGSERARMNVIHEVGLFQGRLGFTKAIVLLGEGCEEFSNIQGLGQIRFPRGKIAASFEEVRAVIEREGLIEG